MRTYQFFVISFLAISISSMAGAQEDAMTVSNQNNVACLCVQGVVGKNVQSGTVFALNKAKPLISFPFAKLIPDAKYRFVFTILDSVSCTTSDCPNNPDTTGVLGGALTLWYSQTQHKGYMSNADFNDSNLNVDPMNDSADKIPVKKVIVTYK